MAVFQKNQHSIPAVPMDMPAHHRLFFTALRNSVLAMSAGTAAPGPVTNLSATAIAGGVSVVFTQSDGNDYILYAGGSADRNAATAIDLGTANAYQDNVGAGGVSRWYWVQSRRSGCPDGPVVGPVSAVTLALGTATTLPNPPPSLYPAVVNQESGQTNKDGSGSYYPTL